eukprot:3310232-Rhodomonas_salina.1
MESVFNTNLLFNRDVSQWNTGSATNMVRTLVPACSCNAAHSSSSSFSSACPLLLVLFLLRFLRMILTLLISCCLLPFLSFLALFRILSLIFLLRILSLILLLNFLRCFLLLLTLASPLPRSVSSAHSTDATSSTKTSRAGILARSARCRPCSGPSVYSFPHPPCM